MAVARSQQPTPAPSPCVAAPPTWVAGFRGLHRRQPHNAHQRLAAGQLDNGVTVHQASQRRLPAGIQVAREQREAAIDGTGKPFQAGGARRAVVWRGRAKEVKGDGRQASVREHPSTGA